MGVPMVNPFAGIAAPVAPGQQQKDVAYPLEGDGPRVLPVSAIQENEEEDTEEGDAAMDSVARQFEELGAVGTGVYGTVFKARCRETGAIVAVKKLRLEDDYGQGVPASVIREVVCLRDFKHPNIVEFLDIHVNNRGGYSLIFEFVEGDLHQMLKGFRREAEQMPMDLVKRYSLDLLNGVLACHNRLILHRDLKPQNILVGRDGLKIGDFGLARMFQLPMRRYTMEVITLWYRAPEILLGCQTYAKEVDMWSAGCIIAEMATNQPVFPGDSEIGTIFKIFKVLGTPTEQSYPGLDGLEHYKPSFPKYPPTDLADIKRFRSADEIGSDGLDLLRGLLQINPALRMKARRAKESAFVCQTGEFGGA